MMDDPIEILIVWTLYSLVELTSTARCVGIGFLLIPNLIGNPEMLVNTGFPIKLGMRKTNSRIAFPYLTAEKVIKGKP